MIRMQDISKNIVNITADDIVLTSTHDGNTKCVSIKQIADFVEKAKEKTPEVAIKIGAISTALLGAGAIAAKNPKISRRFWK